MQQEGRQGWRQAAAAVLLVLGLLGAGFFWSRDTPIAFAAPPPPAAADSEDDGDAVAPPASDVTPADREARRLARYDRDDDGKVGREEYLASRRKAFARLDKDGDGRLGFEEYAAATVKKFSRADTNGDGALAAAEFATTAPKRRAPAACVCGDKS